MSETADVIVIGAGMLGVATAYQLARRQYGKIVVLERDTVCSGSTALASGGIRLQWSTPICIELTRRSLETFNRFEEEFGTDLPFDRCGYLYLAQTEQDLEAYRANVTLQRSMGVDVRLLSPDDIRHLFPYVNAADLLGGAYSPDDGRADPYTATLGIAARARDLGVSIRQEHEVTGFLRDGDRLRGVVTRQGSFEASKIVLAAGPWSCLVGRLVGLDLPVRPRRRDQYLTGPFPLEKVPSSTPFVVDQHARVSVRREGQVLTFGRTSPDDSGSFDRTPDWDALPELAELAAHRCPALREADVARGYAGLLETSPDHNGIVSPIPGLDGAYLIGGFSGHGFMQGPAAGELLAEMIVDGQATTIDATPLSIERFERGELLVESLVSFR